ncbi:MAG: YccF family protein [Eubacteriaceae bacterium]|nr:YccF family protein [Eubacteriaceae bacterium]
MRILGNIIWLICGGWFYCLSWFVSGCLWCLSVVGMPWGVQCFKYARLFLAPMGLETHYRGGLFSGIANIIWFVFFGIPLAVEAAGIGIALCVSIIGIPWGIQCFKIAAFSLMPFGSRVRREHIF